MQKTEFVAVMSKLRACYQNAIADPEMWGASVNQYWEVIQHRDAESTRIAFAGAWRSHPDWMPSLGQMMELIEMHEKGRTVTENMQLTQGEAFSEPDAAQKIRDIVSGIAGEKGVE